MLNYVRVMVKTFGRCQVRHFLKKSANSKCYAKTAKIGFKDNNWLSRKKQRDKKL